MLKRDFEIQILNHKNIILVIILGCDATGSAWYSSKYDMCTCKANIVGDHCHKCTEGFFGFPSCTAGKFFMRLARYNLAYNKLSNVSRILLVKVADFSYYFKLY